MKQQTLQNDLFQTPKRVLHHLGKALIEEYPSAFTAIESARYMEKLRTDIGWSSASIRIAGKHLPIPRLQCWIADPELTYTYSGMRMAPQAWPLPVLEIRARVQDLCGHEFNSVLANLYRDGNDSVSWHADDEPELGPDPIVASVSFGAERIFEFKPRQGKPGEKYRILLRSGTLLVMGKSVQRDWLHQIPKVKSRIGERISLTFRKILP